MCVCVRIACVCICVEEYMYTVYIYKHSYSYTAFIHVWFVVHICIHVTCIYIYTHTNKHKPTKHWQKHSADRSPTERSVFSVFRRESRLNMRIIPKKKCILMWQDGHKMSRSGDVCGFWWFWCVSPPTQKKKKKRENELWPPGGSHMPSFEAVPANVLVAEIHSDQWQEIRM